MNALSKLVVAIALTFSCTGAALAQESAHHAHAAHQDSMADGEIRKIDKESGKLTIRHGELKQLGMGPMTMVFKVNDAAMLDQVKVGDKVKFAAERANGALSIVRLENAQ